jgi:SOS-response transcriptional repressor LexA
MRAQAQHPEVTSEREKALTEMQQRTLNAVRAYIDANGISPTLKDLKAALGLSSLSPVQFHLKNLQAAGAIEQRRGVPRSIRVLWPRPEVA